MLIFSMIRLSVRQLNRSTNWEHVKWQLYLFFVILDFIKVKVQRNFCDTKKWQDQMETEWWKSNRMELGGKMEEMKRICGWCKWGRSLKDENSSTEETDWEDP